MRSGTTTAYRVLRDHPEIFFTPTKEPHFLASDEISFAGPGDEQMRREVVRDFASYEKLFAGAGPARWRGDASPAYLYAHSTPHWIKRYLDTPLVVLILRDPCDRAYSAYSYLRGSGREPLASFEDALEAERDRREAGWAPIWHYREASHYRPQLERYLDVVGPQRLHVLLFDDLVANPQAFFSGVFMHLGVAPASLLSIDRYNRSGTPNSRPLAFLLRRIAFYRTALHGRFNRRMPQGAGRQLQRLREGNTRPLPALSPEIRRELIAEFLPDIAFVEQLTGRNLDTWRYGLSGRALGT